MSNLSGKERVARGCLSLFFTAPFVLVFAIFFTEEVSLFRKSRQSESWPSVQGRMLEAWTIYMDGPVRKYSSRRSKDPGFRYGVLYSYSVNGQIHKNNRYRFSTSEEVFSTEAEAKAAMANQKPGPVTVHYSPEDPADSTITHEYYLRPNTVVYGLVIAAVAAFLFWVTAILPFRS